jgi:hypothetical protein
MRDHLCLQGNDVIALMMGTQMVRDALWVFNELTLLLAREDFINISCRESIASYIILGVCYY